MTEQPKDCEEQEPEVAPAAQAVEKLEAGTADFLVDLEGKRSIKVRTYNTNRTNILVKMS